MVTIDDRQHVLPLDFYNRRQGERRRHGETMPDRPAPAGGFRLVPNTAERRRPVPSKSGVQAAYLAQEIAQQAPPRTNSQRPIGAASAIDRYRVSMADDATILGPVRDVRLTV